LEQCFSCPIRICRLKWKRKLSIWIEFFAANGDGNFDPSAVPTKKRQKNFHTVESDKTGNVQQRFSWFMQKGETQRLHFKSKPRMKRRIKRRK